MLFIYLVSVISGILYGVTENINKNITEEKYSAFAYCFIQNFSNFLLLLLPFLIYFQLPNSLNSLLYMAVATGLYVLGNVSIIKAYKTEDISNLSIIARMSLIVAVFAGVFLLSEPINLMKIIGVITIAMGVIVILYEGKTIKISFGFILAIISGITFGFAAYFQKLALQVFNPLTFLVLNQPLSALLVVMFPSTRRDIPKILKKYAKKIFISRISAVFAIFLFAWSLKKGNISIVNTNNETAFLLSSVAIGILFLDEKRHIAKKLLGSLLCTLGIILLNFF